MDDAAIHRVSRDADDLSVRLLAHSGSPRAFSPRDDKGGGICDDNNWRKGTVRAFFSLFPLHPSIFTLPSLAFLKGDAEADTVTSMARVVAIAFSRTHVRSAVIPGTTPSYPIRARCRSGRIDHRVAGGIIRLVPVRGPLPHISAHIEKAPRICRILTHITSLRISTGTIIRICDGDAITP